MGQGKRDRALQSPALKILVAAAVPVGLFWYRSTTRDPAVHWCQVLLEVFLIGVFAFLPPWLFVRFFESRGPALWDEYVVNLHRLGLDDAAFLPEPPVASEYHSLWETRLLKRGIKEIPSRNLYEAKFDAYYGRGVAKVLRQANDGEPKFPNETLLPVVIVATMFGAGWASTLLGFERATLPAHRIEPVHALAFTFAGSYLFVLQTLVRRYFQRDLRASAYTSAILRVVSSLIVGRVIYEVLPPNGTVGVAAMFIVGMFPLAGLQALRRLATKGLGWTVPTLVTACPLSDIQGMTVWYESRLLEEGIEDAHDLVTANLVDVILHTKVPASRLVDWLDQAHLLLYLEPSWKEGTKHSRSSKLKTPTGTATLREALATFGIRRATTLLAAFRAYTPVELVYRRVGRTNRCNGDRGAPLAVAATYEQRELGPNPNGVAKAIVRSVPEWSPEMLLTLVRVIANNTALTPVLNWQEWGAPRLFELETGCRLPADADLRDAQPAAAGRA